MAEIGSSEIKESFKRTVLFTSYLSLTAEQTDKGAHPGCLLPSICYSFFSLCVSSAKAFVMSEGGKEGSRGAQKQQRQGSSNRAAARAVASQLTFWQVNFAACQPTGLFYPLYWNVPSSMVYYSRMCQVWRLEFAQKSIGQKLPLWDKIWDIGFRLLLLSYFPGGGIHIPACFKLFCYVLQCFQLLRHCFPGL
eukprot:scaffold214053_cov19-Tisochrysis_lutea.AAC.1